MPVLKYHDGTAWTEVSTAGPQGPPGPSGATGPTGVGAEEVAITAGTTPPAGLELWVDTAAPASPPDFLPLTGGTLSGDLTVSQAGPSIIAAHSTAGSPILMANGPVGQWRTVEWSTTGVARWKLYADSSSEAAGAGSDLSLARYDDTGAFAGTVATFSRATGGTAFSGDVVVKSPAPDPYSSLTVVSDVETPILSMDGPAGKQRVVQWSTATKARWKLVATTEAETGADTGSDIQLLRYHDDGSYNTSVFTADRATGVIDFTYQPTALGLTIGATQPVLDEVAALREEVAALREAVAELRGMGGVGA